MERIINIDKKHALNGSFTVEMSLLMPMILFLVMGCVLACFYYHDKNIIAGAAYETAAVGSTKAREKDGIQEAELKSLISGTGREKVHPLSGSRSGMFREQRRDPCVGRGEKTEDVTCGRKQGSGNRTGTVYPGYPQDKEIMGNERMERKITIEEHVLYKEDYQMKMLKANSPEGFLKVAGRGMNGSSYYDYDVSGKISMQAMYTRAKLKAEDIRQFMYQFGNVLKETGKYLLDIHCILLEPEYIFYEEGQFFFCYYPPATQDLWEKFHVLTEYMVKVADYEEERMCPAGIFAA